LSCFSHNKKGIFAALNVINLMEVIFILIGFSLLIALGFLVAFIWATKSGQYDDDYTPSIRMLFDDDSESNKNE
jgi:cbb3-type cytochrome oxidase maturation protein